jgi:hypothetical protein
MGLFLQAKHETFAWHAKPFCAVTNCNDISCIHTKKGCKETYVQSRNYVMKKLLLTLIAASYAGQALAAEVDVTVQNLTRGIYFTPLLVAAHPGSTSIFEIGAQASPALQAMAEGGNIDGLTAELAAQGATISNNPAEGLLASGQSATTLLNTDDAPGNTYLSIAGIMLPTNDGFIPANNLEIPSTPGTYTFFLNAYDAGTEANDEILGSGAPGEPGFPAPGPIADATGSNGSGVQSSVEGFVHFHRGVLGDADPDGGISDIDNTLHRWANPVAKLTIVVR